MASHQDLKVWQLAQHVAAQVHRATRGRASNEVPAVVDQIRRSSQSVSANIAEGRALGSSAQFKRHLSIALGSAAETDSHMAALLALDLVEPDEALRILDDLAAIQRMLVSLQRAIMHGSKPRPR
ncbi:MAG: four helix bundle protein [Gemmatimonadaceae bacterium]|nr:four helix bundle protein [Gemmatimonadaceae bacterium]